MTDAQKAALRLYEQKLAEGKVRTNTFTPKPVASNRLRDQIIELQRAGKNRVEIAFVLGITTATVKKYLRKARTF